MRELHLFAGAGGGILGGMLLGIAIILPKHAEDTNGLEARKLKAWLHHETDPQYELTPEPHNQKGLA